MLVVGGVGVVGGVVGGVGVFGVVVVFALGVALALAVVVAGGVGVGVGGVVTLSLGGKMKLDEIEKLIAAASPGPWPKQYGNCDFPDNGLMACGPIIIGDDEEADENQAQDDQDFICMARLVMPKLLKVAAAAKLWLSVADIYSQHRDSADRQVYKLDYMQGREIFRNSLEELEQS